MSDRGFVIVSAKRLQPLLTGICVTNPLQNLYENLPFLRPPAAIDGIIFAVAVAPEIPLPSIWWPWTLASHPGQLGDEQLQLLGDELLLRLRDYLDQQLHDAFVLPDYLADDAQLAHWCAGVLLAQGQLSESWQSAWQMAEHKRPAEFADWQARVQRALKCLKVFARQQDLTAGLSEAELRGLKQALPAMLRDLIWVSGELAALLPGQLEQYSAEDLAEQLLPNQT